VNKVKQLREQQVKPFPLHLKRQGRGQTERQKAV
jgi:hypothetical protein